MIGDGVGVASRIVEDSSSLLTHVPLMLHQSIRQGPLGALVQDDLDMLRGRHRKIQQRGGLCLV